MVTITLIKSKPNNLQPPSVLFPLLLDAAVGHRIHKRVNLWARNPGESQYVWAGVALGNIHLKYLSGLGWTLDIVKIQFLPQTKLPESNIIRNT